MIQATKVPNTSGKWASSDDMDEQIETLNILEEYITFSNKYNYTEDYKEYSGLNTARVNGFWLEESDLNQFEFEFVVYMSLEDDEVELRFPIEKEKSGFIDRNWILEEFLKIFGVTSDNIEDILGRKVLYEDHRGEENGDLDFGLTFYNSRKTKLSRDSQKLSIIVMLIGTVSMILFGLISEVLMLISLGLLAFGIGIASIDVIRRRKDRHGVVSIKNYLIE
jgi:hypothetical protein